MARLVRRTHLGVGALPLLLGCIVSGLSAAEADALRPTAADTVVSVVSPRPDSVVRQDVAAAQAMEEDAVRLRRDAVQERAVAKARVDVTKAEIAMIDDSIGLAKKDKLDEVRKRLEGDKDRIGRRQKLHEAHEDLGKAREDLAEARVRYARERLQMHRQEFELAMAGDAARPTAEARLLEAAKKVQERAADLADREKQVIERQLRILEVAAEIREKG